MIVSDTQTLVWSVTGDATVSKKAKTAINHERNGGEIHTSTISAWEIAMLVEREKLQLTMEIESWLATVAQIAAVRFVLVNIEIATKSVNLSGEFYKNPADRMIVATARKFSAPLITKDEKFVRMGK